jgi:hypothetical protein
MARITIKNSFHRTQVTLNTEVDQVLTPSQAKRAEKALCGMDDCMCGGIMGGDSEAQHVVRRAFDPDGNPMYAVTCR